jgi:hypothetical protein
VFGAREDLIRPKDETQLVVRDAVGLPGLNRGDAIAAAAFEEDLTAVGGGRVLARFPDGEAAMVDKSYGRGRAVLIGSFAGLAYQRKHDPSTARLLLSLAGAAGVQPRVQVSGTGITELEVRKLVSDDQQFVFVFNHSSSPADAAISIRLPWKAKAYDLVANQDVPVQVDAEESILQKKLDPDAIWVVRLQAQ